MATYIFGEGPTGDQSGLHKSTAIRAEQPDKAFGEYIYAVTDTDYYPLIRYNMVSILGESIDSAYLTFYSYGPVYNDATVGVHKLLSDWGKNDTDEGATEDIASGGQATWNNRKDFNSGSDVGWAAGAGVGFGAGDYAAVAEGVASHSLDDPAGTSSVVDITAYVTAYAAGTQTNDGFVLIPIAGIFRVAGSAYETVAYRHFLTVVTSGGATGSSVARQKSSTSVGIGIGV